jgi:hypothetical protein
MTIPILSSVKKILETNARHVMTPIIIVIWLFSSFYPYTNMEERLSDTKGVIRSRKSNDRQYIMCIVCHLSRDRHVEFIVFPDNSANILL